MPTTQDLDHVAMCVTKLRLAELRAQHLLLPVRVIEAAGRVVAERLAGERVDHRLHRVALGHLGEPRVVVIQEAVPQLALERLVGRLVLPQAPEPLLRLVELAGLGRGLDQSRGGDDPRQARDHRAQVIPQVVGVPGSE